MNIEIRKLTPDLADDYARFFDVTPHDDLIDEHKCYCVCWCKDDSSGDYEAKYLSSAEKRRAHAIECVKSGSIQGYLAYSDGQVVGWCNANTKADCLKCYSWRRYMGDIPAEEASPDIKVKAIFCFVVAPDMRRKGLTKMFVERVCQDAAQDGFDYVESYPNTAFINVGADFMGPAELYRQSGFFVCHEAEQKLVMRKRL